ncbi:MAG: HEAT repeat domain-containing protein [Nitrospinae bacterium]|nr:HEAT repeat domain-containing protein [Nitrospinota bacterium]
MDHQTEETLLKAIGHNDANVRKAAAIAIGKGESPSNHSLSALLKLLKDKVWQVREAAIHSIGALNVSAASEYLMGVLGAEDDAGARKAILTWAAAKGDVEAKEAPGGGGGPLGGAAAKKKPEGEPWQIKRAAALALSKLRPDIAVAPLMAALGAPNPAAKQAAMVGLGNINAQQAIDTLVEMLADDDFNVRKMAATTLGKLKAVSAVPALLPLLEDGKAAVRTEVVIALNHIKPDEAVEALGRVVAQDASYDVRKVAATALGNLRSAEATAPLLAALGDDHPPVRKAAIDALVNLKASEEADRLIPFFNDPDEEVAAAAAIGYTRLDLLGGR